MGVFNFNNSICLQENVKKYFDIREKVFEDLKRFGNCLDVDELLTKRSINCLVYVAIVDAYYAFINRKNLRFEYTDRRGGTGEKWIELSKKEVIVDEIKEDLYTLIQEARNRFESNRYSDGFGASQKNNLTETKAIENAKREADKIIEDAKNKAKQIEDDARNEAESIISNARARERNLLEAAESQKQLLIDEGYAEKEKIINNISRKEYKDSLEKCIKDHFESEQLEQRKIRERLDGEYDHIIKSKNDMIDGINLGVQGLHSSLMLALDDVLTKLQNVQADIHNEISSWQRSLYKNELSGIAMCFMTLDRIILSMEDKISAHLAFKDEGYHKEVAEELSQSVKNLKILKNNFELSLAKNSIKLLIPKVGDSFNTNYHRADNVDPMTEDEDSFNGKSITAVSDAGLIRILNSSDEIMFKAIVTVEK